MFSSTESSVDKLPTIWHRNWQSGKLEVTNKRIKNNISVDITLHILQTQIVEESLICFLPNKIWRRWIDGNLMSGWRRPQQASTLDHIGKIPYTIDCIYTRKAIYMILWLQFFFLYHTYKFSSYIFAKQKWYMSKRRRYNWKHIYRNSLIGNNKIGEIWPDLNGD